MKKLLSMILALILVATAVALPCSALAPAAKTTVTRTDFEDGSYMITTLTVDPTWGRSSTASGSKTVSNYTVGNILVWELIVEGTFSYNGSSATATKATGDYKIYDSGWRCTSINSYCSGASAITDGTFKGTLVTKNATATLSCSPSGVLS